MKKLESHRTYPSRDAVPGNELWTDGLICAFEFIRGQKKLIHSKYGSRMLSRQQIYGDQSQLRVPSHGFAETSFPKLDRNKVVDTASLTELRSNSTTPFDDDKGSLVHQPGQIQSFEKYEESHWVPIGWARISELVQTVQVDAGWASQVLDSMDDEEDLTVADLAAPYWQRPAGPVWWCHVSAGHPSIDAWLSNAQWLHPAISLALRDEGKLISEKMKHLLYEVKCS